MTTNKDATISEFDEIYDSLKPVADPQFLIGDWKGGPINTAFNADHPSHIALRDMKWAGKRFNSTENVDPIMIYGDDDKRVCDEKYGHARVCIFFSPTLPISLISLDHLC